MFLFLLKWILPWFIGELPSSELVYIIKEWIENRDKYHMILIFTKGVILKGFPDSSIGKESTMWETWVQFLGLEDLLGKG